MALTMIRTTSCTHTTQFIGHSLDQDHPMDTVVTLSFRGKDSALRQIQSVDLTTLSIIPYRCRLLKSGVQCLLLKLALPSSETLTWQSRPTATPGTHLMAAFNTISNQSLKILIRRLVLVQVLASSTSTDKTSVPITH